MVQLLKILTAVMSGAALGVAPQLAQAAVRSPVTLVEHVDWPAREFTFTATGALCDSGTFQDSSIATGAGRAPIPKVNAILRTTYTCDDGSGTFEAVKHVFITINPGDSETFRSEINITSGTDAYKGLRGHLAGGGSTTSEGFATAISRGFITL